MGEEEGGGGRGKRDGEGEGEGDGVKGKWGEEDEGEGDGGRGGQWIGEKGELGFMTKRVFDITFGSSTNEGSDGEKEAWERVR